MSIRSANNKRTQNHEYTGMGRKSAASAKPARAAASSVRVVPASAKARRKELERGESLEGLTREEKKARKREARLQEDRVYTASNYLLKQDEEYKSKRRIFWVLMAVAIVMIIVVWGALVVIGESSEGVVSIVEIGGIVVSYAAVIGAFIFDFVKIRPLRNYYRSVAEGMTQKRLDEVIAEAAASDKKKDDTAKEPEKVEESAAQQAPVKPKKSGRKKDHRSRR